MDLYKKRKAKEAVRADSAGRPWMPKLYMTLKDDRKRRRLKKRN